MALLQWQFSHIRENLSQWLIWSHTSVRKLMLGPCSTTGETFPYQDHHSPLVLLFLPLLNHGSVLILSQIGTGTTLACKDCECSIIFSHMFLISIRYSILPALWRVLEVSEGKKVVLQWKEHSLLNQTSVWILNQPSSYVTLGKTSKHSEPQFSYLHKRNTSNSLIELRKLHPIINKYISFLAWS